MIYGGPSAPYALEQHETPWYRHPVGQWKYLEQPMKEASASLLRGVAREMTRGFSGTSSQGRSGFGFGAARVL
jgi:hypothetical protein